MSPMLMEPPMTRRNDSVAKIDAQVIADAKVVAAFRGETLAEYLSELIRPLVSRDLQAEMSKRLPGSAAGRPSPAPKKGGGK